jgi:hypothetical protein
MVLKDITNTTMSSKIIVPKTPISTPNMYDIYLFLYLYNPLLGGRSVNSSVNLGQKVWDMP